MISVDDLKKKKSLPIHSRKANSSGHKSNNVREPKVNRDIEKPSQ